MLAARGGKSKEVLILIKSGADLNIMNKSGRTALSMGLVEEIRDDFRGSHNVVKILLEAGANPNIKSNKGRTVLDYAAIFGDECSVALLIKHGANPKIKNSLGESAIDHAKTRDYTDIVILMKTKPNEITEDDLSGCRLN